MINLPIDFYEFDNFRLDMHRYVLHRGHELVPLGSKAFATLLVLIQNRERVVKKTELINIIWPDSYVEESNLAQNVFVLRKALGDEKENPRYIVTIPGSGYRFIAPVRELREGENVVHAVGRFEAAEVVNRIKSIAVLPFISLAQNEPDKILGVGLADALITRLSRLTQVKVRPTTSVLQYSEMKHDPQVVGRDLKVDSLVDGIFQRDGGQIRVSVQFVRVVDGSTLWAAKFDEQFTDIFSIQDSISKQVASALASKLSSEEQRSLRKNYTASTDAFQLFIKGRYFWNQRSAVALRKGMSYAQQAIAIDPTYAPAYVGIADSYNLLAGHGGLAPKDTFPKAKAAAMRALEIDDTLAEAYASLGFVNYRFEWDWATSEQNFRRAIELKPTYATAHHWFGESLAAAGRFEESLAAFTRSQELDPLSLPINTDLGQHLFFAGRLEESEDQLLKTLEMDQRFIRALIVLGAVREQMGRYEEALSSFAKASGLSEKDPFAVAGLGYVNARLGRKKVARQVLSDFAELSQHRYVSAYNQAVIYAGLGEKEKALARLEQALHDRDVWLVWLKVDPCFDCLRDDPRFVELLHSVGFTS